MILDSLRAVRRGLDTNELSREVALHPNTVRWHLSVLAGEGLVEQVPERRHGRGRPSIVYRPTGDGMARGRDEYQMLATMLTEVVSGDEHGEARAYETGVRWGRHLQRAEPDLSLVELLDQEGFAAVQRDDRVEMRRCPFYALAEDAPQVICTLHHGIVDGALEEMGSGHSVARLDPFVEPGLCIAHLDRWPGEPGASIVEPDA